MELWERLTGWVSVELTSADPERALGQLVHTGVRLQQIKRKSELIMSFQVQRSELPRLRAVCEKKGDKLRIIGIHGVYYRVKSWGKHPILLAAAALILFATCFLPSRVLFIRVEGNHRVPDNLILETASQFGVSFGAARRELRSERIKNELLGAMPELEWVGVNTKGCVATITVQEREPEPEEDTFAAGNVISSCDGIVDSITLVRGNLLCREGQAVRAGQILVSGYSDLGICTHIMEAEAEIYAMTAHPVTAVLPQRTLSRGEKTGEIKKYSLVIGKNRINLYSDSGILLPTYDKMTQVKTLTLPGGLVLPVKLVVETYTSYELLDSEVDEELARNVLQTQAQAQLHRQMLAGQILTEVTDLTADDGVWRLAGRYGCREMIARQQRGVFIEGDTKDGGKSG